MSELISYKVTKKKRYLCATDSNTIVFVVIAIAYLNIQESFKNVWTGHRSKRVSQSREKLADKSSWNGQHLFQTPSIEQKEYMQTGKILLAVLTLVMQKQKMMFWILTNINRFVTVRKEFWGRESTPPSHPHPTEDCSDVWFRFPEAHPVISYSGAGPQHTLHFTILTSKQIIKNDWKENSSSIAGLILTGFPFFHSLHLHVHFFAVFEAQLSNDVYKDSYHSSRRGKIILRILFSKAAKIAHFRTFKVSIKENLKTWFGYSDTENFFIQNG